MSRWVVTGGAGFIGSHLVAALLARGDRVVVLETFASGTRETLAPLGRNRNLRVIEGCAGEPSVVAAAMAGSDGVFHLAAKVRVQDCIADWLDGHRANATMALTVMHEAARAGRPVVYASSAAVYGDRSGGVCHEELAERPRSPYGADKLACEHHARAFWEVRWLPSAGLRFFNVYGPGQRADSPYAGVIARLLDDVAAGRAHTICGDGRQTRDFVHVSDVVRALCAAMARLRERPAALVANVCTGHATSILEAAAVIDRLAGRTPRLRWADTRPGDIRHSRGDPSVMRRLGIGTTVPLEVGLADMVAPLVDRSVA